MTVKRPFSRSHCFHSTSNYATISKQPQITPVRLMNKNEPHKKLSRHANQSTAFQISLFFLD